MNRRGFLRGAISVMAMAAILKGAVPKEKLIDVEGHLTTYFMNPGDYVELSGTPESDGTYWVHKWERDMVDQHMANVTMSRITDGKSLTMLTHV